jgi:hypothetical protein
MILTLAMLLAILVVLASRAVPSPCLPAPAWRTVPCWNSCDYAEGAQRIGYRNLAALSMQ